MSGEAPRNIEETPISAVGLEDVDNTAPPEKISRLLSKLNLINVQSYDHLIEE